MTESEDFRLLPLSEVGNIVARFEKRVSDAQLSYPPTREMVRRAIRRQGAPRCPVRIKRLSLDIVLRHGDALADLFCEYPDDLIMTAPYESSIGYQPHDLRGRIDPLRVLTQSAEWADEWGTRWGHAFGGVGATPVDHPLKDWSQLDEYLAHGIPDPRAAGRLDGARPVFTTHGQSKYCGGIIHLALFERLQAVRGMQNLLMDFYTNEREVRKLGDAIARSLLHVIRGWAEMGADSVYLTDDWGTQTSLMLSLEMWRSFFAEHYRTIFEEIHRHGMDVMFHSCGNVMAIVPDLITLGVDVLDPIQPGAMDQKEVARQFGGKVAFFGGIDDQRLATHTPEQIREEVRRTIETLGAPFGNALIVAPANIMTPEIPLENLRALFEACHAA
ncbi:MAG: uroporphyrinogen decarboxylase family protein [Spirochaetia bacterium]|jgi:uroporphyrinogen decarboxylase